MRHAMRTSYLLTTLTFSCLWAACSFPNVEYETECMVPVSCQNDVDVCWKQAEAQQTMCTSKCMMTCGTCDVDYDQMMAACVAQCETCSANGGCANATGSCKALLGVP